MNIQSVGPDWPFDLSQCHHKTLPHEVIFFGAAAVTSRLYERHYEESVSLTVTPEDIFSYADDFAKLSAHMNNSSSMIMGGSMETTSDQARGQAIGSHVRMSGKMMGVELSLEEVVTKREPPHHKAWETIGRQCLLVIDAYRLGFDIVESHKSSVLRVFIDYNLPAVPSLRWFGVLLGHFYAKWCVRQMVNHGRSTSWPLPHCSPQYGRRENELAPQRRENCVTLPPQSVWANPCAHLPVSATLILCFNQ